MANRKVTIKDVAARAGVSVTLVSFVMSNQANGTAVKYRVSDETARRILQIAAELNYQPNNAARALRNGRTRVIGVILSDISNKFFADIARCIEDRAFECGYSALFGSTDESAERLKNLIEVFLNKGVDGLILVPCEGSDQAIRAIEQRNVPLVLLDREVAGGGGAEQRRAGQYAGRTSGDEGTAGQRVQEDRDDLLYAVALQLPRPGGRVFPGDEGGRTG